MAFPLRRHDVALVLRVTWNYRLRQGAIGIRPSIPGESPAFAHARVLTDVEIGNEYFLSRSGFSNDLSKSVGDKRRTPELNLSFRAHTVHCRNMDKVRNAMAPLNCCPGGDPVRWRQGVVLEVSNCGGIKQNVRTEQSRGTRRFGKPLVVTDQHAKFQIPGFEYFVTKVAGFEVTLLIKEWIVWNVDFSIRPEQCSIRIDDHGRVEEPVAGDFEDGHD